MSIDASSTVQVNVVTFTPPMSAAVPIQNKEQPSRISGIANSIFDALKKCGKYFGGFFTGAWNVISNGASALANKVTALFRKQNPHADTVPASRDDTAGSRDDTAGHPAARSEDSAEVSKEDDEIFAVTLPTRDASDASSAAPAEGSKAPAASL